MLSIFNRFLSRIRSAHPIFSDKHLLVLILQYLEGHDLYQVYQVSFLLKMTIDSVPVLEITLLKFRMRKSNECIIKLKNSEIFSQQSTSYIPKFVQRAFVPYFPMVHKSSVLKQLQKSKPITKKPSNPVQNVDLNEEKWVSFVNHFQAFAEFKGFKVITKSEFKSKEDWKKYKVEYLSFYQTYVEHLRDSRNRYQRLQEERSKNLKPDFFTSYKKFIQTLNFSFHKITNYKYFPNRSERKSKPTDNTELLL